MSMFRDGWWRSLWSCLALGALVIACACRESGPRGPETGPAGKVIDVSGAVNATRGTEPERALAAGDTIYARDVIRTDDGASVTIELTHNGARWQLGGGVQLAVRESAAWSAKPGSGGGFAGDQRVASGAAGRHSENEAGETGATATEPTIEGALESGEELAVGPGTVAAEQTISSPQPETSIDISGGGSGAAGRKERELGELVAAKANKSSGGGKGAATGGGASGGITTYAPPEKEMLLDGDDEPTEHNVARIGAVKSAGGLDSASIKKVLVARRGRLLSCSAGAGEQRVRVQIKLTIGADGKVVAADVQAPDQMKSCLLKEAKALSFPKPEGGGQVVVEIPLVLARE